MTDQLHPFEGYRPARNEGDIVPLAALFDAAGHCPDLAAASRPHPELKGFRLMCIRHGMGERPIECWRVETVGGPHDGQAGLAYVFKPGHEPQWGGGDDDED
jgi:hypothetical protein